MFQAEKKIVGIWVDHTNAWIVRYDKGVETILKIESQVDPRVKHTGGSHEARVSHHKIEGRRYEHAQKFYHEIISKIGAVDDFVLMGPGSAKTELKKNIARNKSLAEKLRDTFAADHMTDRQIAARVREFFHMGNDMNAIAM